MHFQGLFFIVVQMTLSCTFSKEEVDKEPSNVILIHVVFRHGIRTPDTFYPTDPYLNHTFFPLGPGILTNRGKRMMFKLGSTLRKHYGKLLGEYYHGDKLTVRTASSAKTKMSAQLVLAGLWPPVRLQRWNDNLDWQPIPFDSDDEGEDSVLESAECLVTSPLVLALDTKRTDNNFRQAYKKNIDYLERHSNLTISTPIDALSLYVTLVSEQGYGLELPEWTESVFPEPLQAMSAEVYEYQNANPLIATIQSGFLLRKILNDTNNKINNITSTQVMHVYSSQETVVGGLLNSLKVLKKELPHFGSAVIIEIHKQHNQHFVKIKYIKNPLKPEFWVLPIPNCDPALCPWEKFEELYKHLIPTQRHKELCPYP